MKVGRGFYYNLIMTNNKNTYQFKFVGDLLFSVLKQKDKRSIVKY